MGAYKSQPKADPKPQVLVLRSCPASMVTTNGFKWPESGIAEAPDWSPEAECGHGLHGFLNGEGDGSLACWDADARWLVCSVDSDSIVDLRGKAKFPRCEVVFCGDRKDATEYIAARVIGKCIVGGTATAGVGGTATAGDRGTATAGDSGTATAGDRGTATAGHSGTATAGDRGTATAGVGGTATAGVGGTATAGHSGTATAGDSGTATAGVGGTATAGHSGTATAGHSGTATAGDSGTATAGHRGTATAGVGGTATAGVGGTATAGHSGTATAGVGGTATAGYSGTATAGHRGVIAILYWNGKRYKTRIGHVKDEDGDGDLLPNVKYRLNDKGEFVVVA